MSVSATLLDVTLDVVKDAWLAAVSGASCACVRVCAVPSVRAGVQGRERVDGRLVSSRWRQLNHAGRLFPVSACHISYHYISPGSVPTHYRTVRARPVRSPAMSHRYPCTFSIAVSLACFLSGPIQLSSFPGPPVLSILVLASDHPVPSRPVPFYKTVTTRNN